MGQRCGHRDVCVGGSGNTEKGETFGEIELRKATGEIELRTARRGLWLVVERFLRLGSHHVASQLQWPILANGYRLCGCKFSRDIELLLRTMSRVKMRWR